MSCLLLLMTWGGESLVVTVSKKFRLQTLIVLLFLAKDLPSFILVRQCVRHQDVFL
jgi:hypothetical protein